MLLFTIIFFAMVITVGSFCIFGFSFYLKRRTKLLNTDNHKQIDELPPYRSLFEPTDEEIRALEQAEKIKIEAKKEAELRQVLEEKLEKASKFLEIWLTEPNKLQTIELLRLASESKSAETFSEIAENVIRVWYDKELKGLTAKDLADLLDSHLRILPQQERTSGVLFWLKQEITSLRTKSEDFNKSRESGES